MPRRSLPSLYLPRKRGSEAKEGADHSKERLGGTPRWGRFQSWVRRRILRLCLSRSTPCIYRSLLLSPSCPSRDSLQAAPTLRVAPAQRCGDAWFPCRPLHGIPCLPSFPQLANASKVPVASKWGLPDRAKFFADRRRLELSALSAALCLSACGRSASVIAPLKIASTKLPPH